MPFAPGANVGPYTIIEQLGQGGMATVYKAYHAALDRYVALKALHPAFKGDPGFMARFTREARIVAKLMHPNIVPVYNFAVHVGRPCLVRRFIAGQTLKARLEEGSLEAKEVRRILRAVGDALTYAHEQGVLHRDVKPSNVILTGDGQVFLADFGLARIAASGESTLSKDMMVGTPHYISPEQAQGEENLDARTDIYSLGVVLFQMLTGRVPFSADTPYAIIHDHIFTPLPLPSSIDPTISPAVERVLLKALAKARDDRFASVAEMVDALEQAAMADLAPEVTPSLTVVTPTPQITPPLPPTAIPDVREPAQVPVETAPVPEPVANKRRRWLWVVAAVALLTFFGCVCCAIANRNAPRKGAQQQEQLSPQRETLIAKLPTLAKPIISEIKSGSTEALMEEGDAQFKAGKLAEALLVYQTVQEIDPDLVPAYLRAGDVLVRQEEYEEAARQYQEAVNRAPENVEARLKLAAVLSRTGQWQRAGEHYQKAVELRPDSALAHAGLARYHMAVGNLDTAHDEVNEALELAPDLPEAHFVMGLYHLVGRRQQQAIEASRFVLDSSDASLWLKQEAKKHLDELQGGSR